MGDTTAARREVRLTWSWRVGESRRLLTRALGRRRLRGRCWGLRPSLSLFSAPPGIPLLTWVFYRPRVASCSTSLSLILVSTSSPGKSPFSGLALPTQASDFHHSFSFLASDYPHPPPPPLPPRPAAQLPPPFTRTGTIIPTPLRLVWDHHPHSTPPSLGLHLPPPRVPH